jgi:hypothetical protein
VAVTEQVSTIENQISKGRAVTIKKNSSNLSAGQQLDQTVEQYGQARLAKTKADQLLDRRKAAALAKKFVEKIHKQTQKMVAKERKKNCPKEKSIEKCYEKNSKFKSYFDSQKAKLKGLSDAYTGLDDEVKRTDILELMAYKDLDEVGADLGQLDGNYKYRQLEDKMDDTLLGQYVADRALMIACGVEQGNNICQTIKSDGKKINAFLRSQGIKRNGGKSIQDAKNIKEK